MIYRQSIGIVALAWGGLAIALAVAQSVGSFVVVNVWDPATYLFVELFCARRPRSCYLPARRAMTVEPSSL